MNEQEMRAIFCPYKKQYLHVIRTYFLAMLVWSFLCPVIFSQETPTYDVYADISLRIDSLKESDFQDAIAYSRSLLSSDTLRNAYLYGKLCDLYFNAGHIDSSKICGAICLDIMQEQKFSLPIESEVNHNLGRIEFTNNDLKKARHYFLQQYCNDLYLYPDHHIGLLHALNSLGIVHTYMDQYSEAKSYYDQIYDLNFDSLRQEKLSPINANIALVFRRSGMLSEAVNILETQLDAQRGKSKEGYSTVLSNLGDIYIELGEIQSAIRVLTDALAIREELYGGSNRFTVATKFNLCKAYLLNDNLSAFQSDIYPVLSELKNLLGPDHLHVAYCYQELSSYHLKLSQSKKSVEFANKAIKIYRNQTVLSEKNIASCLINIMNARLQMEQELSMNMDSVSALLGYNLNEPYSFHQVKFAPELLEFLKIRLEIEKQHNKPEGIDELYNVMFSLVDFINSSFEGSYSKDYYWSLSRDIYESAIIYYLIQQNDIDRAFEIGQKSKALQQKINLSKSLSGLTKNEHFQKFSLVTKEINYLRRAVDKRKAGGSDEEQQEDVIRLIQNESLRLQLMDTIEKHVPQYFNLLKEVPTLTLSETRSQLNPDESLIDYFVGDEHLVSFIITPQSVKFSISQDHNSLAEMINSHNRLMVENFKVRHDQPAEELKLINEDLYKLLISPIQNDLNEKIIIIPDGLIGSLSFESLINPIDSSYLIDNHQFRFIYSSNSLNVEDEDSMSYDYDITTIAPEFGSFDYLNDSSEVSFQPLFENTLEAERIAELYPNSQRHIGNHATQANFEQALTSSRILHLATHSKSIIHNPSDSYLVFHEDTLNYKILYADQLLQKSATNQMIVLSSCESGIGPSQYGNGVFSLANSLLMTGAKSVVFSLWKVNDKFTSDFMLRFYEQLLAGKSKCEALNITKLHYKSDPIYNDPYYWSGFQLSGDNRSIELSHSNTKLRMLLTSVMALLVVCVLYFIAKNKF